MVEGSCLCGSTAWSLGGELSRMSHWHCSMCRKAHGSAFATYVAGKASEFRWLRGEADVAGYESSPGFQRRFCPTCGSVVPSVFPGMNDVFVPAGSLDDDPGVRPEAHIFASDAAPWHTIGDTLPRFDRYPPGVDAATVERAERPTRECRQVRPVIYF